MTGADLNKHLLYWIFPSTITLLYIFTYFFNLFGLGELVAPEVNREFGLAENTQLFVLILIIFFALKGYRARWIKIEKYGFIAIAVVAAFLFLEEIDYGYHHIQYLSNANRAAEADVVGEKRVRNVHNNGNLTSIFKFISYMAIVLFFVVLPLIPIRNKKRYPLVNFLSPSRTIIITAFCLLLINQVALFLSQRYNYTNRSLQGNVSEFEEMMTYYIVFLYVRELVNKPEGMLFKRSKLTTPDTSV
jgi:hypothetical protein